jgi:hypothetical protein
MRVYDLKNEEGCVFAFEVKNLLLGRRGVLRVVERIPNARIVSFSRRTEDFCEFDVGGVRFVVSEPWNDSSRFWIGQKPIGAKAHLPPQLALVREAFLRARPMFGFLLGETYSVGR